MKTQSDDVRLNCIGIFSTSFTLLFLSLKTWVHETSKWFFINFFFKLCISFGHMGISCGNNLVKILGTPQSTIRLFLIDHSFTGKVKVLPISLINS